MCFYHTSFSLFFFSSGKKKILPPTQSYPLLLPTSVQFPFHVFFVLCFCSKTYKKRGSKKKKNSRPELLSLFCPFDLTNISLFFYISQAQHSGGSITPRSVTCVPEAFALSTSLFFRCAHLIFTLQIRADKAVPAPCTVLSAPIHGVKNQVVCAHNAHSSPYKPVLLPFF